MSTEFSIQSIPPDAITHSAAQPGATDLSTEEIRICFPSRIAMAVDGQECIVLEDAPVMGVLVDISESWLRLKRGAPAAEVIDFYGEYKLVFRETGGYVECENEFAGDNCRAPAEIFIAAVRKWSGQVLATLEERYPDIGRNANYERLKAFVLQVWHDDTPL